MLTDAAIRKDSKTGRHKLWDMRGLYLLVRESGSKSWQWDYVFQGKRKTIAFGQYDDVTLQKAREKLQDARRLLADGQDPMTVKRESKRLVASSGRTFETVARAWFAKQKPTTEPSTQTRNLFLLEQRLFPTLGPAPIASIGPRQVLAALQKIEDRGTAYTAHRVKQLCSAVFRYAVAHGWADRDITADLRGALTPVKPEHRAAITDPGQIGPLLRAIDGAPYRVRPALQLLALVFVRPGELQKAEWSEIDLEAALWRIPAGKMKMREPHLVPLSTQAVTLLTDLKRHATSKYVFPHARTNSRPMSADALNAALRRIGYGQEEMTAHGFRSMARTVLAEVLEADPFVIECQLAHAAPGPLGAAYNRAKYLPQRKVLLQTWADYLDGLKAKKP